MLIGRTDAELQSFGHLIRRADSLEKTLILGKIEGKRKKEWQRMRWLDSITDSSYMNLSKWLRWLSVCLQCGRPGFDPWVRKIPWIRKWQSTPVLLPGKSHGQRSLVGYSPWDPKESDTTEWLHFHFHYHNFERLSRPSYFQLPETMSGLYILMSAHGFVGMVLGIQNAGAGIMTLLLTNCVI